MRPGEAATEIRFHSRVALVRALHWLACRYPLSDASAPAPAEATEPSSGPDLLIAPSLIPDAGLGLFTRRPFDEGEQVCVYSGVPLSTLQALRTPDWRYLVGLGKGRHGKRVWIDGRPVTSAVGRYVNHHFDPGMRNIRTEMATAEALWVMRASRPIGAGEELYCDYGRLHWHCFDRELLPAYLGSRSG
jgi:hypothetical protein